MRDPFPPGPVVTTTSATTTVSAPAREVGVRPYSADQCEVLVVDDDPTILYLVAQALEMEGRQVMTAANGQEALDILARARPQVVLLDMRMPVLDGWGFARVVREQGIPLKIVVMTATTDARRWADEIGADAFLGKPFDLEQVLEVVDEMCRD